MILGAGAAGVATGVALVLLASGARSERDAACGAAGCQDAARDDDTRYRGLLLGADVALGLGSAAFAGGLLWGLLAPRGERPSATAAIVPMQGGAAVQIGGCL